LVSVIGFRLRVLGHVTRTLR